MNRLSSNAAVSLGCRAMIGAGLLLAGTAPASAETIRRSVDVHAPATEVWKLIGPYCAIKDWLPPVGRCIEDGKTPSTRVLVTKDGQAAFVELQTARNEAEHSYSYTFLSSPLPVRGYASTIRVKANSDGTSTVTWSGAYYPERDKEKVAFEALSGVYDAGLAEIKGRFAG